MEKQLFNLTLPVVNEEIGNILSTYPNHPYKQAFSPTGLRQELVAYVLSRVPNKYTVIEYKEMLSTLPFSLPYPSKQLLEIEHYIQLGIRDILPVYHKNNGDMRPTHNLKLYYLFSS
ncbi:hypothetical protein [Floridanema evergladense]|uniref:LAGLIDADG homing endonuclease n=1 Tax=Floridaenema evergladense BLCC-F167 TaxID=3153639 RepID=A0ABV4WLW6_9CYAN